MARKKTYSGKRISGKKRALYALIVLIFIVVITEALLRALGLFAPVRPFTEFTDNSGRRMARYNLNSANPEFPVQKPGNVFRIMVFGGKTSIGFPFHYRSSFGIRLAALLEQSFPQQKFEVLHLGKMGMDSKGVREALKEALDYSPDLVIVYTGHNEYISFATGMPSFSERVADKAKNLRVVRVFGGLVYFAAKKGRKAMIKKWEEDPGEGAVIAESRSISTEEYERVKARYEKNLEAISRLAGQDNVPLVFCTPASNLAGWPPEPDALPPGFGNGQKRDAWKRTDEAGKLLKEGRHEEAVMVLEKAGRDYKGYAPVSFYLGRARTALWIKMQETSDGAGTDKAKMRKLRSKALADLNRALAEEARCVRSHRAPPDLIETMKKVARQHDTFLFDTAEILQNQYVLPGFELFEDHCHPTLKAQQIIAANLAGLLKEQGIPAPADDWEERPDWQEMEFLVRQNVDYPFLHKIRLNMGIYLGLRKNLPHSSKATRENFQSAYMTDPQNPLPLVLETVTALHYKGVTPPLERLSAFNRQKPEALQACFQRYLTERADLRQGMFMARIETQDGRPPLRGHLKTGMFTNEKEVETGPPPKPLAYYNRFLDIAYNGEDVTEKLAKRIRVANKAGGETCLDLLDHALPFMRPGKGMTKVAAGDTYEVFQGDAYLTTGIVNIDPLMFSGLSLSFTRQGNKEGDMVIAWSYQAQGESRFAKSDVPSEGTADEIVIELSEKPRWIEADKITEVRLFPSLSQGRLKIKRMELRGKGGG